MVLPVLDTTGRCRVKKAVVGVTELIAALVTIHSVLVFLADKKGRYSCKKALRACGYRSGLKTTDGVNKGREEN